MAASPRGTVDPRCCRWMAALGQEGQFALPGLSGRFVFSDETFRPSPGDPTTGKMRCKGSWQYVVASSLRPRFRRAAHASPRRIIPSFSSTYCPPPAWIVPVLISRSTFG